jgi:hypothetical protein
MCVSVCLYVCLCVPLCVCVCLSVCTYTQRDAKPTILIFFNDQRDAKQIFSKLLEKQAQEAEKHHLQGTLPPKSIINQQNVDGDTAILVCVIA